MVSTRRTDQFSNGGISFWYRQIGQPTARPALPGSLDVDVAIVGAGYTGLWTAYYLKRADPSLRIAVLEREFAGFGASGRNGGWLSGELSGSRRRYAASHGKEAVVALQRAMYDSVDEVISVAAELGIDADIVKNGLLRVARSEPQRARLLAELDDDREWGMSEDDIRLLDPREAAGRIRVTGTLAATWSPHCARIQPAKLVHGLAAAVERLGVTIYEQTPVTAIEPHAALTPAGTVRAAHVLRATEGFTAGIAGQRRAWLPMNSSLIATEPLPDHVWEQIGWGGAELLGDWAHAYMYAQRTADGRIAIGGRGVPYRFGSRWDRRGQTPEVTVAALHSLLGRFFPAAAGARVDHAWSGILGVPRDWCATVHLDQRTGTGWAGGYVGHGVSTANLAGRTLTDLVLRRDTDLVRLPWVGRQVRRWEPEPARWIAVRGLYAAYRAADRREDAGLRHTSWIARTANVISGR
ncbi:NAD(P)/FAD-dependent oxidoreductase [Dactylosporangium sp. NPDC048998]|uniref:NAD(P)/FAD-dependent oxidoreductase n=1 Tax=Dactylosporangium sp. NPDC048998 TaxID=3363976 RepID=UPI0037160813